MLPGFENMLFSHSSWYTYAATMRIYKHWDFRITEPHTATGKLSFSSYPGMYGSTPSSFSFSCNHAKQKQKANNNYMQHNTYNYWRSLSVFSLKFRPLYANAAFVACIWLLRCFTEAISGSLMSYFLRRKDNLPLTLRVFVDFNYSLFIHHPFFGLDHEFIELITWSTGFLMSLDDFYLLGSGLMMTQTTNNVFNSTLFDTVTPNSLFAWQRVRLAHSLAHSGEEWAKTFSKYNSGRSDAEFTAVNNKYMMLLILLFMQGRTTTSTWCWTEVKSSWVTTLMMALWPSWSRSLGWWNSLTKLRLYAEVTAPPSLSFFCLLSHLSQFFSGLDTHVTGYWPSYNIPFHPNIYALSGYGEMWEKRGEDFSYDLCPRAKIFRRDQAGVKDLDSLKHIMRFNGAWSPAAHRCPELNWLPLKFPSKRSSLVVLCSIFNLVAIIMRLWLAWP